MDEAALPLPVSVSWLLEGVVEVLEGLTVLEGLSVVLRAALLTDVGEDVDLDVDVACEVGDEVERLRDGS